MVVCTPAKPPTLLDLPFTQLDLIFMVSENFPMFKHHNIKLQYGSECSTSHLSCFATSNKCARCSVTYEKGLGLQPSWMLWRRQITVLFRGVKPRFFHYPSCSLTPAILTTFRWKCNVFLFIQVRFFTF